MIPNKYVKTLLHFIFVSCISLLIHLCQFQIQGQQPVFPPQSTPFMQPMAQVQPIYCMSYYGSSGQRPMLPPYFSGQTFAAISYPQTPQQTQTCKCSILCIIKNFCSMSAVFNIEIHIDLILVYCYCRSLLKRYYTVRLIQLHFFAIEYIPTF